MSERKPIGHARASMTTEAELAAVLAGTEKLRPPSVYEVEASKAGYVRLVPPVRSRAFPVNLHTGRSAESNGLFHVVHPADLYALQREYGMTHDGAWCRSVVRTAEEIAMEASKPAPEPPKAPAPPAETSNTDRAAEIVEDYLAEEHDDPRLELRDAIAEALDFAEERGHEKGFEEGEEEGKEAGRKEALAETPESETRLIEIVRDLSGNPTLAKTEEAFEWLTAQRDQQHRADLRYLRSVS